MVPCALCLPGPSLLSLPFSPCALEKSPPLTTATSAAKSTIDTELEARPGGSSPTPECRRASAITARPTPSLPDRCTARPLQRPPFAIKPFSSPFRAHNQFAKRPLPTSKTSGIKKNNSRAHAGQLALSLGVYTTGLMSLLGTSTAMMPLDC